MSAAFPGFLTLLAVFAAASFLAEFAVRFVMNRLRHACAGRCLSVQHEKSSEEQPSLFRAGNPGGKTTVALFCCRSPRCRNVWTKNFPGHWTASQLNGVDASDSVDKLLDEVEGRSK